MTLSMATRLGHPVSGLRSPHGCVATSAPMGSMELVESLRDEPSVTVRAAAQRGARPGSAVAVATPRRLPRQAVSSTEDAQVSRA